MAEDPIVPDIEIGRYALRSFKWSVEHVTPKFSESFVPSSPPLLWTPPKLAKPGPYPEPPEVEVGKKRLSEEYEPPPLAEKLGWWDDGAVRVWRSPTYTNAGDWEDGTCRAECHARGNFIDPAHEAPYEGCTCGIYGSLSYADLLHQFKSYCHKIIAVIAAEGTTIIGDRGLRTAFARVVAYWTDPDPMHREVAAAQFKDVKVFDDPLGMVEAYGLRLLPPAKDDPYLRPRLRPQWWTAT